jgi:hypothetical protein
MKTSRASDHSQYGVRQDLPRRGNEHPSYDDKQLGAVLITCVQCGRAFYMTAPQQPCHLCREGRR